MALEKLISQDRIEIVGDYKHIQVRTKTAVIEDGVELSSAYSRHVVAPDVSATDLANESTEVQAICAAVHTSAVKTAYSAHLAAQAV